MKAQNQNYYTPDGVLGEHSYACWYHILLDGELQTSDNIEIGVFVNDVCKVTERVSPYFSGNWYGICFNATYNLAEGETATITFRLYNHETSEEITNCSLTEVLSGGSYGNSPMDHANLEFTHTYAIAVSANPTEGGTVTGAGTYTHGASVTLTALWNQQAAAQPARPAYTAPDWVGPALETKQHPNYVVGYPDGSIHPRAGITRAEVAVIFYRLLTEDSRARYQADTNAFPDVADADWFHTAVSTLTGADILRGYPDGKFYPDRPITRGELTAIITRFVRRSGGVAPFNDVDGHWAYASIAQAAQNGWIKGYEDGSFRPDVEISRAETFAMVNRMLGRQPETASDLAEGMNQFPDNQDSAEWYYLDVQEAANNHSYQRKADGFHERWTAKLEDIRW